MNGSLFWDYEQQYGFEATPTPLSIWRIQFYSKQLLKFPKDLQLTSDEIDIELIKIQNWRTTIKVKEFFFCL